MTKFLQKLKLKCKHCTEASIKVYFRNIKRLAKLADLDEIPLNTKWLDKVFDKYKKLPLKVRRHLSIAAIKVFQVFDKDSDKWRAAMLSDANKHQAERSKNKKSPKEEKIWPKNGIKDVRKASREILKRIRPKLKDEPSKALLYKYQFGLVLRMFTEAPLRNDFSTLKIKKSDSGNYIDIQKSGLAKLIIRKHKSSKQIGERTIKLSRGLTTAIRKFLKYRSQVVDHDYLLSTKAGNKLSKPALGKGLHRFTKEILGKSFGSRLIRILAATDKKDILEQAAELTNNMLHKEGGKQTKQYVRKD